MTALRMPGTPMYPIAKPRKPKTGEEQEKIVFPDDSLCFLIGEKGIYKQVRNLFYEVVFLDSEFKKDKDDVKYPMLADIEESVDIKVYKLPFWSLLYAGNFFAEIWKKSKSEAVVLLYYNPETFEWRIGVPKQKGSGGHVDYTTENIEREMKDHPGFLQFGTIHSHCNFSAFHSGTDDKDEFHFDGLHITIGHVDGCFTKRDYACRWIFAGNDYKTDVEGCVEGYPTSFPQAWLALHEENRQTTTVVTSRGQCNVQQPSSTQPTSATVTQGTAPTIAQDPAVPTTTRPSTSSSNPTTETALAIIPTTTQTNVVSEQVPQKDGAGTNQASCKGSVPLDKSSTQLRRLSDLSDNEILEDFSASFGEELNAEGLGMESGNKSDPLGQGAPEDVVPQNTAKTIGPKVQAQTASNKKGKKRVEA